MSNSVILKRDLGNAAAHIDASNGAPRLYDVLKALVEGVSDNLNWYQATVATGILNGMVMEKAGVIRNLSGYLAVCGTAGATTVQVRVNGTSKGTFTIDNADPDGTKKSVDMNIDVAVGDVVDLNVSAAPTGGTGLTVSARIRPCKAE